MIKPKSLKAGDKAIILSPAGKIDPQIVLKAAEVLISWGLIVEISKYALSQNGRFSGSVEERLQDLQQAFDDDEAKLILCSRGGYGIMHLLDKLSYKKIKDNPKWVVGYSDITALHSALQSNGIVSLHAPMAKHLADATNDDTALNHLKQILFEKKAEYSIPANNKLNCHGKTLGKLFGGNLSVFCGLLGTSYLKIPKNGILCIEDIGEAPYKIDRMIYQLKLSGILSRINGLVVGHFTDYEEDTQMYYPLYESIKKAVEEYQFPVCFDFPMGHTTDNYSLIFGKKAVLEVSQSEIILKQ